MAARDNQREVVAWLWPRVTREGHDQAVVQACVKGHVPLLAALLDRFPADTAPSEGLHAALCYAVIHQVPLSTLKRLMTLTNPSLDQSKALRLAVEKDNRAAIEALVPVCDLNEARKGWTRVKPAQWDMLYKLFPHLPNEVQQKWADMDKGRLDYAQAALRALQAEKLAQPERARRRLRS